MTNLLERAISTDDADRAAKCAFAMTQSGHEGDRLPSSKRNGANHPDATRGSPSQSHHVRADGGLVDKHQPGRIKHTLLSYPAAARSRHIRSLPFGCLQHFF